MAKYKAGEVVMRLPKGDGGPELGNGCIWRNDADTIEVQWKCRHGFVGTFHNLTTRDARLLARRLNQFIDAGM